MIRHHYGRPIELLPSGPISFLQQRSNPSCYNASGCTPQESYYQTNKKIPIGSCHCPGTGLQGKFLSSSTYTDSILILITLVLINFLLLYQHTGTSAKTRSTTADAPQSSQPKRKGSKSTRLQAKRQRTATPSPPPVSPIPVESSPSPPEAQIQPAPSPLQPQEEAQTEQFQPEEPQPEETSADVHEQTADPASLIIASVVSSIQTSVVPPQGNVLSIYCRCTHFSNL